MPAGRLCFTSDQQVAPDKSESLTLPKFGHCLTALLRVPRWHNHQFDWNGITHEKHHHNFARRPNWKLKIVFKCWISFWRNNRWLPICLLGELGSVHLLFTAENEAGRCIPARQHRNKNLCIFFLEVFSTVSSFGTSFSYSSGYFLL